MTNEQYWFAGGGSSSSGWTKIAQTVTTTGAYYLTSVYLPLSKRADPAVCGTASIKLYATDENHKPTGESLLTIGTITSELLTTSNQWLEFEVANYPMLAATEYSLVLEITSAYNDTYEKSPVDHIDDIPMVKILGADGYSGSTFHQWWFSQSPYEIWEHTSTWDVWPAVHFGFIFQSGGLPSAPINPTPTHEATGTTLDDTTLSWEDGGGGETYDVYFRATGEFFEKIASDITDLYVSTLEVLPNPTYVYGELYLWCVIAKNEYGSNYDPPVDFGIGYGGTIWEFNAMVFNPPLPSGVTLSYAGDDDGVPTGTPTGESGMITVRRLVAAANDKIWYEDI